jgi:phosphoribosylglycinamide formyltransferase-1
MKSFAIYCSGGASRILKFFESEENRKLFKPTFVLYDGENKDVFDSLQILLNDIHIFNIKLVDYGDEGKMKPNKLITNLLLKYLIEYNTDFLFCFGKRILKKNLIDVYKNRLINFHPSILPSFAGSSNGIDQAIAYGTQILGNTAHFIDEGIDTGKIIIQTALPLYNYKKYEDVLNLQIPMLKILLKYFCSYEINEDTIIAEMRYLNKHAIISYGGIKDHFYEI